MDLRQQLGAMAAHVFRRPLRVQKFFEQLADARITVHRVPPVDDMWKDSGGGPDSAPGLLVLRRSPRHYPCPCRASRCWWAMASPGGKSSLSPTTSM